MYPATRFLRFCNRELAKEMSPSQSLNARGENHAGMNDVTNPTIRRHVNLCCRYKL